MSLKSYFENFNIAEHQAKVARKGRKGVQDAPETILAPKALSEDAAGLSLVILGPIKCGKNNVIVTRTGHRFPRKSFAVWRDDAVRQVKSQLKPDFKPISSPTRVRMDYWAADARRRDQPAVIDAIFHVLERAGVVTDDWHLWVAISSRDLDRKNPRVEISFLKSIE